MASMTGTTSPVMAPPGIFGDQSVSLLQLLQHWTEFEVAIYTIVLCTWTVLQWEEPVDIAVAQDALQVAKWTKIPRIVARISLQNYE